MSGVFQQTKGKTCSVADIDKCLAGVQVQEWRDTDFQTFKVNWFQLRVIKSELQDINLQLREKKTKLTLYLAVLTLYLYFFMKNIFACGVLP